MQRTPPELSATARMLRCEATFEERLLLSRLRICRPHFTRQLVIDRFIADFACRQARIVVELDGGQHGVRTDQDAIRTATLERRNPPPTPPFQRGAPDGRAARATNLRLAAPQPRSASLGRARLLAVRSYAHARPRHGRLRRARDPAPSP